MNSQDPRGRTSMDLREIILQSQELIARMHEDTQEPGDKILLQAAFSALDFIWSTGRIPEFETYREQSRDEVPAYAVAAFNTRQEADIWLNNHPAPPDTAYVLVADAYYRVVDDPARHRRALLPQPTVELYLEDMLREGLPPTLATFNTREEAVDWFNCLSEKPIQGVLEIGNEPYLFAYHRNIGHLALHPFSVVRKPKSP